ncbi:endonuclease/exonuclease/phosphatase family protein [Vibrio sonorensis]|uniref:endonuclease/exonuclease/phosphatase family protein n=1 Tax=Vibrio sonorensis TaxID=1004316 RepID=UPI0008DB336B|nr:endonuclease/exonuclease/phosphatase family protein [Vibrio sonorensis]
METKFKLTFASANLFNFVAPPNAFYDFENIYEQDVWQEKCEWTKKALIKLGADIIGVQEVFSIEECKSLFQQLGYEYFACVDTPNIEQDYIYSKPVVALASKYPLTFVKCVAKPIEIESLYQASLPEFSRKPLHAIVTVPEVGEVAVYVCHLKSQRASESQDPEQSSMLVGRWLSAQQRAWEAVMLRLYMEREYRDHPIPTVLMGDVNQTLESDITGLLIEDADSQGMGLGLKDSWWQLSDQDSGCVRRATHYHFAIGNVLDYILVSQEFHLDSQYSLADLVEYKTLDEHLINPKYELDKCASDHAFIAVSAQFVL